MKRVFRVQCNSRKASLQRAFVSSVNIDLNDEFLRISNVLKRNASSDSRRQPVFPVCDWPALFEALELRHSASDALVEVEKFEQLATALLAFVESKESLDSATVLHVENTASLLWQCLEKCMFTPVKATEARSAQLCLALLQLTRTDERLLRETPTAETATATAEYMKLCLFRVKRHFLLMLEARDKEIHLQTLYVLWPMLQQLHSRLPQQSQRIMSMQIGNALNFLHRKQPDAAVFQDESPHIVALFDAVETAASCFSDKLPKAKGRSLFQRLVKISVALCKEPSEEQKQELKLLYADCCDSARASMHTKRAHVNTIAQLARVAVQLDDFETFHDAATALSSCETRHSKTTLHIGTFLGVIGETFNALGRVCRCFGTLLPARFCITQR
ncbi:MAG: hypothetical protein MHM6MM_008573 [Cercozoa sp. M6MM]